MFPIRTNSQDGYTNMELFIDEIKDPVIQNLASQTIKGSGAFRRFKDFIRAYLNLEQEWYTWKDDRSQSRAWDWLEEEGLVLVKIKP